MRRSRFRFSRGLFAVVKVRLLYRRRHRRGNRFRRLGRFNRRSLRGRSLGNRRDSSSLALGSQIGLQLGHLIIFELN
ncbi:MAG TPA: hypothetical protein VFY62_16170, partial [Pseudomonas sp.]|nr:hypothetical protein [Pseudomonas sp.]